MRLTRQHFELIAMVLRYTEATTWQIACFANELAETNPNFDRVRFVNASLPENRKLGPGEEV